MNWKKLLIGFGLLFIVLPASIYMIAFSGGNGSVIYLLSLFLVLPFIALFFIINAFETRTAKSIICFVIPIVLIIITSTFCLQINAYREITGIFCTTMWGLQYVLTIPLICVGFVFILTAYSDKDAIKTTTLNTVVTNVNKTLRGGWRS
jgi:hypothetical protein